MLHRPNYYREYYHMKRLKMIEAMGGSCKNCGNQNEEELCFVYIGEDKRPIIKGRQQRYQNIAQNPFNYMLLCRKCKHLHKTLSKNNEP